MQEQSGFFDFNTAQTNEIIRNKIPVDRDEVEGELRGRAEQFVLWLYPEAILEKQKAYIGDVRGGAGQSLCIDTDGHTKGRWHDFASGDGGGDFIGLYMAAKHIAPSGFVTALTDLAEWAGVADNVPMLESHLQRERKARKRRRADIGPPVATWIYRTPDGTPIAEMRRHEYLDHKGRQKKEFIAFTYNEAKNNGFTMPNPRPIYNAHLINSGKRLVFCEGEKAADAVTGAGFVGLSIMGGANAVEQTDYALLAGKQVALWRDNDEAGLRWQDAMQDRLAAQAVGIAGVVDIPNDKPVKWDAADTTPTEIALLLNGVKVPEKSALGFRLRDWGLDSYTGEPEPIEWLVQDVIPLGVPCLLASMGGVGKSFKTLELGLEVALNAVTGRPVLGGSISAFGSAVIVSAEDSKNAIKRRLCQIVDDEARIAIGRKLTVVAAPDAGGVFPLIAYDANRNPVTTPHFDAFVAQLLEIKDLRLVVIDPLQAFMMIDVNKEPAHGQFMWSTLARICALTGATMLVTHHMSKKGGRPIKTAEEARDAVRGSTALIDGCRAAYALWAADGDAVKEVADALEIAAEPNTIIQGALVKSNEKANNEIQTFVRAYTGLLADRTQDIKTKSRALNKQTDGKVRDVFELISKAWNNGNPLSNMPQTKRSGRHLPTILSAKGIMTARGAAGAISGWLEQGFLVVDTADKGTKKNGLRLTDKGAKLMKKGE